MKFKIKKPMSPLPILIFITLLLPFPKCNSSPIILPLSHAHPHTTLSTLTLSSLSRAHRLKRPSIRNHTPPPPTSHTPLNSHSYGGYSLTLYIGTPPQPLPLLLDTGSSLPWVPCTASYLCRRCSNPPSPFIPKSSSSSKLIGCLNPKCSFIHSSPSCSSCSSRSNCSQLCPPYFLIYGSGSTSGVLLSDSIHLSSHIFRNLAFGCSLVSITEPSAGIASFGRGSISIPSQTNLTRFSYCLISRKFDDNRKFAGSLILNGKKEGSIDGVRFTPFLKNPHVNDVFTNYYYIGLREVMVGGIKAKIDDSAFEVGEDGNRGVIIDSGTTFTYMEKKVFEPMFDLFVEKVGEKYKRDELAEKRTGLRLCYELLEGKEADLPELVFRFKGGAEMKMPLENYFTLAGDSTATICLTIVTDGGDVGLSGPAVILGSFQQQNFYVVYDLEREKLGFRKQRSCIGT